MPWTFAHPAAVLPLARLTPRYLSMPALVAGTLAPDAFYYVGRFDIGTLAHTPLGLIAICGPVGLLLLALLRAVKRPLVELLPSPHREALLPLEVPVPRDVRTFAVLFASVAIGAATHLFLDAFTHDNGLFVDVFPVLGTPLFRAGARTVHLYHVLQHLGTIVGTAILAACYWRFLRAHAGETPRPSHRDRRRYALLGVLLALAGVTGATAAYAESAASAHAMHVGSLFVRAIIYATSALAVLLFLAATIDARRRARMTLVGRARAPLR